MSGKCQGNAKVTTVKAIFCHGCAGINSSVAAVVPNVSLLLSRTRVSKIQSSSTQFSPCPATVVDTLQATAGRRQMAGTTTATTTFTTSVITTTTTTSATTTTAENQ